MNENEVIASMITDDDKKDIIELIKDGNLDDADKLIKEIYNHKKQLINYSEFKKNQKNIEPESIDELYEQLDDLVFEFCCKLYILEVDSAPEIPNKRMRKLKQQAREIIVKDCGLLQNDEVQKTISEISNKKLTIIDKIQLAHRNNKDLNLSETDLDELVEFIADLKIKAEKNKILS